MIATLPLNDQYGCRSFSISALVNGQHAYILIIKCCYSYFFCCHVVWYVCAWLYCIDGDAKPGIYISLFLSWLCLGSQYAMNSCGPYCIVFLYFICVLLIVFFESCVIVLQHVEYHYEQLVICNHAYLTGETGVIKSFWAMGYAQCFSLYVAMAVYVPIKLFLQMLLSTALHCWELHSLWAASHPSLAEVLLLDWLFTHLSLCIAAVFIVECQVYILLDDCFGLVIYILIHAAPGSLTFQFCQLLQKFTYFHGLRLKLPR